MLAAELTETTRLYARCAARIEPEWIEAVAGERVERDYFDPHWDRQRGEVVASERVTLYGLPSCRAGRFRTAASIPASRARYSCARRSCPASSTRPAPFLAHNRALLEDVAKLEHKARRAGRAGRRRGARVVYAERVPAEVHSARRVRSMAARGGGAPIRACCT